MLTSKQEEWGVGETDDCAGNKLENVANFRECNNLPKQASRQKTIKKSLE